MQVTEFTTTIHFRHIYPGDLTPEQVEARLRMWLSTSPYNDYTVQQLDVEATYNVGAGMRKTEEQAE